MPASACEARLDRAIDGIQHRGCFDGLSMRKPAMAEESALSLSGSKAAPRRSRHPARDGRVRVLDMFAVCSYPRSLVFDLDL